MSTLRKFRPITVEEYLAGEAASDIRHEFVGGEVFAMVGATVAHDLIAMNIVSALLSHLGRSPCRVFTGTTKLRVGEDFFYPDVFVACDPADDAPLFKTRPLLIVEVLSPSTVTRDTRLKMTIYKTIRSLRDYVLVEQERRRVRVVSRAGQAWRTANYTGTTPLRLPSVDLTLSLDEVYRDVAPSQPP
jgi:Uma2 family endonuclease